MDDVSDAQPPSPGLYGDTFLRSGIRLIATEYIIQMVWLNACDTGVYRQFASPFPAGILPTDTIEEVRSKFRSPPIKHEPKPDLYDRFLLSDSHQLEDSAFENVEVSVGYFTPDGGIRDVCLTRTDSENYPYHLQTIDEERVKRLRARKVKQEQAAIRKRRDKQNRVRVRIVKKLCLCLFGVILIYKALEALISKCLHK